MALTDNALKALKPKEKRYKIFDRHGLYIEVLPTGATVWRIRYTFAGKERRQTIGRYPALTLKDARRTLEEVQKKLDAGIEPFATSTAREEVLDGLAEKIQSPLALSGNHE